MDLDGDSVVFIHCCCSHCVCIFINVRSLFCAMVFGLAFTWLRKREFIASLLWLSEFCVSVPQDAMG